MRLIWQFLILCALVTGIITLVHHRGFVKKLSEQTLIVGTSADYPPFSYIEHGAITGFDIDLIREVAHRLGKEIELRDESFDMLMPQLQIGAIHLIATGMTYTPQRSGSVSFTQPYSTDDPLVILTLAKHPPITSLDDLTGKMVVVNDGYTADTYMSSQQGPLIKRLSGPAQAILDLNNGNSYAYVTAHSAIKPFLKKYNQSGRYNLFVIDGPSDNYSFAVSKKYPELLTRLNDVLRTMKEDGSLAALKKKWDIQ